MTKKSDKKLCWNCDGDVSLHLSQCPYCGSDVSKPEGYPSTFKEMSSPFQSSSQIPKPPYANLFAKEYAVSDEEWNKALEEEKEVAKSEEKTTPPLARKEIMALLLLLPGIVLFFFGLILFFFSEDGVLTVSWKQNLAYFYIFGALPLLFLGWKSFK